MAGVAAALILVVMIQVFRPMGGQSSTALASDIVMADPAVLAALESCQVEMVTVTKIVGDTATMLVEGAAGESLSVEVGLRARAVIAIHEEHSVIAQVWMTKGSQQWFAYVNLDTEQATDAVES